MHQALEVAVKLKLPVKEMDYEKLGINITKSVFEQKWTTTEWTTTTNIPGAETNDMIMDRRKRQRGIAQNLVLNIFWLFAVMLI